MQILPVAFSGVGLLLAAMAIMLLLAAELASPYYGQTNLMAHRRKIETAALLTFLLFMITVVVRISDIVLS